EKRPPRDTAAGGDPAGPVRSRAASLPAPGYEPLPVRPRSVPVPVLRAQSAPAEGPGVPDARPPGPALARRHQRLDQRPDGLQFVQHAQGQPPAGRGGDAPNPRAVRAALRAPLLGGAPPHADPEPLHPAVLRRRRARHPRGDVSGGKLPWLIAGGAVAALVLVVVAARGGQAAHHPQPRLGVTAERVLPPSVVPNTPNAAEA